MRIGITATAIALLLAVGAWAGPLDLDSDMDGLWDLLDICSLDPTVPSPCPFDTNADGYGNACDGDFNDDGSTDFSDIAPFGADLGAGSDSGIGSDMNCDGAVDFSDIGPFGVQLGQGLPGPSGLVCAGTIPCP
jgi:hypothetical protein